MRPRESPVTKPIYVGFTQPTSYVKRRACHRGQQGCTYKARLGARVDVFDMHTVGVICIVLLACIVIRVQRVGNIK